MACAVAAAGASIAHRLSAPHGSRCRGHHRSSLASSRNWWHAWPPPKLGVLSSVSLLMRDLLYLPEFSGVSNNVGYDLNFQVYGMGKPQGTVVAPNDVATCKQEPNHLLVLVHGILASPNDWLYTESELKRQLGSNFLIYASSSNTYTKTFSGIDGAGRRLADEVMKVVQKMENLKRISFLAHSLGGLIARYAVAIHYSPNVQNLQITTGTEEMQQSKSCSKFGTIAGLEPINFITLATPHLGVRGRKQLPFLFGVPILEKLIPPVAPLIAGQTGRQLFLMDGKPGKPPLLLRMASDCEDLKFISSLGAFRSRVLYANVAYDHMVGWRTSSIRRETELLKAVKAKEAAQAAPSSESMNEYYHIMEEEMIRGLQRLGWTKVDVSFHSAFWPFFAHNNIHVKNEWLHNAGAGVIAHVADNLQLQEWQSFIPANL